MATVEIVGPFEDYRVTLNGYHVPNIQARPMSDGTFLVSIDNRFIIHKSVSKDELENWMPILANAMAVAAGYTSHGEHSQRVNEYNVGMNRLYGSPSQWSSTAARMRMGTLISRRVRSGCKYCAGLGTITDSNGARRCPCTNGTC